MILDVASFRSIVPASIQRVARLNKLYTTTDEPPCIAVFGKYNHGKSTLLNAIVGSERFRVSDRRETTEIAEHEHEGVVWIDTPGLDGDPAARDDKKAWSVAFERADLLFLVHQVQAGELDRYEMNGILRLSRQDNYSQKMVLVLTQIDERDEREVCSVERKIRDQLCKWSDVRQVRVAAVSAERYQRGGEWKEISRMELIFEIVEQVKSEHASLRLKEKLRLSQRILLDLDEAHKETDRRRREASRSLKEDARRIVERLAAHRTRGRSRY